MEHNNFIIGRPINGIALNGFEFVLDDDGNTMRFPTEKNAKDYLMSCGYTDDGIDTEDIRIMIDVE